MVYTKNDMQVMKKYLEREFTILISRDYSDVLSCKCCNRSLRAYLTLAELPGEKFDLLINLN